MARFVSYRNPVPYRALKRRELGAVVVRHGGRTDIRFTRTHGGWLRARTDVTSVSAVLVSSAAVAAECNSATGCKESWAKVY